MLLALRLFAGLAAALQFAVATHIVRRPAGPFRWAAAALLAFNAVAAARLALLGGGPSPLDRWMLLFDGATGPMLLACGLLALRFPDHDRRDRRGFAALAGGLVWSGLLLALGATPFLDRAFVAGYEWLHTVPALLGLAIAGVALARALGTALADRAPEAGLVALGFLPTLGENAAWAADHLNVVLGGPPEVTLATAGRVAGQALVVLAALATLALLVAPWGRNRGWRRALAFAMVASALAYLGFWNLEAAPGSTQHFAVYLGTTTSFYVLRPLGLGLAYSRSRTLWTLFDLACAAVLLVLGKALSVLVVGTPPGELRFPDAVGLSVALLVLPLAAAQARRLWKVRPAALDRPSSDELLGRFLLDHYRRHGPDATAGKREIEAATGIAENNLAAAIRRLERRLGADAAPGTFVAERREGVRGRKRYRLTAQGLRRLGPPPPPRT